ncbi:transposase [Streptomyces sp. NPDC048277]|uniref:transposase n=1 Tax=Streptomyces sp. NPDC048277 TaxID=3155027 RepID=UPI0033C846AE
MRTDAAAHRTLPANSELTQAVAVLARAQQDAVWDRTQAGNKLPSHLREYFPGYLAAVQPILGGLCSPLARALLAAAPTPARAARQTTAQLRAVLKRAGRQRGIEAGATRLHAALRSPQMRQPPLVEDVMGRRTMTLLRKPDAACTSADELAEAAVETLERHPDAEIVTSFPGLGSLTGARILAEIGDDPFRFADARALKSYAGAAPVTRASGKSTSVKARRIRNQRLAAAGYIWTDAFTTASATASATTRPSHFPPGPNRSSRPQLDSSTASDVCPATDEAPRCTSSRLRPTSTTSPRPSSSSTASRLSPDSPAARAPGDLPQGCPEHQGPGQTPLRRRADRRPAPPVQAPCRPLGTPN